MLQNEDPFISESSLMRKLRQDESDLQSEKKEYEKYQAYLNTEIDELFTKNEQLLSCFMSHKKIFEDLELQNRLLEEQYNKLLSEESRSKKIKARLYQLKTKQDPIFPSKVLIPMENNTENQHIILSKEYHDLESKISEINVDDISNLLEEKQKLEERHVKLQKEASELMALLIKPENKLSDETESLFYHMLSTMNECDKSRKKFFILKHGSQQQIDELKLNSEASKSEAINVIDLLNLFPDIEPSPNLQTLINEEMENKKRKEAKRKRIEAMKKKDEEFLRNLNHRQRSNYFQIRPPDEKKVSSPKESISDSGEKSKNDQINRLRSALNNQYAELKKSNPHPISLPNADDSVLPSNKKNGRRKINSNQIQKNNINDNQIHLDQITSTKSHKLIRKKRKKHSNQNTNSMFPKKIYSSEFASSSSTSAARKREENNLIYSLDQNKEENNLNHLLNQKTEENNQNHSLNESKEENKFNDSINHKKEENKFNDSINHKKEENKFNDSINHKKEENKFNDLINHKKEENNQIHSLDQNKDENKLNHLSDQSKEENINSDIDDNENKGDYSIRKSRKTIIINIGEQENDDNSKRKIYRIRKRRRKNDEDEGNYQLNIEEESDSETANGNTFEFEQTLELDSRWRFHVSDNEKDQQKSPAKLQIGHNPRQFVEEESNKEDYSKTEFLQEIVSTIEEEEEEIEEDGEKFIEKVIIHKKRSKRRRKHQYHENEEKSKSIQKENELKDNQTIKDDNLNEQNNDDSYNPMKTKMHSIRRPSIIKIIDSDPIKKRRSNSAENENQESQKIHRRKRKSKHRSKSIDQDEEESNISQKEETTSQKIAFKLEDKQEILKSDSSSSELNTKEIEDNKTNKSDDDNNNDDNVKKPLKKIPMKKKRLLNLEIAKKPVIIDEQKSTIDNLGSRPHHSRSNDKNRHKQRRSSNSNDDNKSDKSNEKDNDYDYPSDKNYEYNIEYDYEFDDKDYYSNDNKHTKRRRHGHHYRRKTNRRFYTHHPRHHYQHHHHSNHHHNSRYNRYTKPKTKNESKSRKDYDYETPSIEEEEEVRKPKLQQQRRRNRSQKQEPRRTRRNNDYYSNSDSYSDSYLYSDNDYDYNDSNGYNSDSDGYEFEFEVHEEEVFAPLKLQISKDAFCHEEKEKIQRNPRVFQRKIIPKQPESDKKSLLSMSLKGDNDPSNHQIKESKTYTKLNTLNDFVIHEPNEAYESLRKKGRGEQLDLEIAKTREKLAKIENEIKELQKKLKSSLLKEATSQVDEPFSMQSLSSMKNEIKSNENIDDLIDQARKQKELLEQELTDKQNRLSELQKQYVRKTSTLRHYKQLKDELNEKNFFLINASKKQIKKLNDLDEQIRRGRRTIEIIDGRIADLKNIIDLKTKELSVKANKKRPNVVEMCSKFKKDRLSEKEILQLIDYHDIERQYLEKEIESISYQLSDDSLTKKGFEIERIVIIAKQLKEKYFQKRGMANQTMITITNEDDLNLLAKRKTLTKEEIHSTMMQIDLVISQIQKQISQLSNKNIEVPPTPSSFNNLQAIKKSKLESVTSLS